jgi:alpha-L-rhamnosidase
MSLLVTLAVWMLCAQVPGGEPPQPGLAAPSALRCEYLADPMGIDVSSPRFSWLVSDPRRGARQSGYQVVVHREDAAAGEPVWDSGKVAGEEGCNIAFAGRALESGRAYTWKVRTWDADDRASEWSEPAHFSMGLLAPADWKCAWVGLPAPPEPGVRGPATMLRARFTLGGLGARRATLYATALGLYECRLNGRRIGDRVLAPEWTDYRTRIQYQTYDVTPLLTQGENVLGAVLADGWYAGKVGLFKRETYGRDLALRAQLQVELADGSMQVVVFDGSWRATSGGPWLAADILDGVRYDGRRQMSGWDRPGFDDSAWIAPQIFQPPAAALVAQMNDPVRVTGSMRPVALTRPKAGEYVFDLGQNMTGWVRLLASGPAGAPVTLQYAEALNPDGTVYTANLRGAAQRDTFILAGRPSEMVEPAFTYHGFRYVQVSGLGTPPVLDDVVGRVVHSDLPPGGTFECSDAMLNQLMSNIVWTHLANMQSTPTDCPQRDERLGWMGDAQVFAQAACFNRDMASFFTKWLADVRDAQSPDGAYPDFAPNPVVSTGKFMSVPAWGDAGVIVPWRIYQNYADLRLLQTHFESARRWVDSIQSRNPDLVWHAARGNDYNDWLNGDTLKLDDWPRKGAEIPRDVFATAFFEHSTRLVSRMAHAIGREDDAAKYTRLADDIRRVFQEKFCTPDGTVEGDTQAGYALALHFDLLPQALRPAAVAKLVQAVHRYNDHVATGFISTVPMMEELVRAGHADLAYTLLLNRTIPSWGYMIDQGATTVWERWDGYVAGRGFQDPGMNSLAHYAIGSVGEWMYRHILGINPDDEHPGYRHFEVRPVLHPSLTWARGSLRTIRGEIRVDWVVAEGQFRLGLTVPPGTSARVVLPSGDPTHLTEGGRPAAESPGVHVVSAGSSEVVLDVTSGRFDFETPAPSVH